MLIDATNVQMIPGTRTVSKINFEIYRDVFCWQWARRDILGASQFSLCPKRDFSKIKILFLGTKPSWGAPRSVPK